MNPVTLAALFGIYLTLLAVLVYFCIIADPHTSRTARYLTLTLPTQFWRLLRTTLGRESYQAVEYLLDRALVLFYCTIVYGGWSIVLVYVYPWIGQQEYLSHHHRYIGLLVLAADALSWRMAHMVPPGLITAQTLALYDHYPYDDLLFVPGQVCPTRHIPKLARSKFDRHKYQEHVARFDHYCGWVHNTLGEENYRWFLLFVVVHVGTCLYGTYCLSMLLYGEMVAKQLWQATFFDRYSGKEVPSTNWILFQYAMQTHFAECSILLITAVMSVALGLFLLYHAWLTSRGLTTNESYKWDAIQRWHKTQSQKFRKQQQRQQQTHNGAAAGSDDAVVKWVDDPGPAPVNIYDRGVVENWREVLFPPSLQRQRRRRITSPTMMTTSTTTKQPPTEAADDRNSSPPMVSSGNSSSRKAD